MEQKKGKVKESEYRCKKCSTELTLAIRGRKKEFCKPCFKERKKSYDREFQSRKYEDKKFVKKLLQISKKGKLPEEIEEALRNRELKSAVQRELSRTGLLQNSMTASGIYEFTADISRQEEIKRKEEQEASKIRKIVQEELKSFLQELCNKSFK
ncbi:MAG: hypothetical protein Q7S55_04395 [Nanoarchaeota archaeon]|nr:hypothetical protein [Nanoarchaeota archaeon]